jgi:predicted RNA-binding protein with PIN domain
MWLAGRLDDAQRARTTVVFDAKRHTVEKTELIEQGIRVLFAVDFPDADSLIEMLIAQHSAPKFLTVVSSDQRILSAALRRRAQAMKSTAWFEQIESRFRAAPNVAEPEEKPSVGDRDKLISEFDTDEIQRLIDDES